MTSPIFSARRAAKEALEAPVQPAPERPKVDIKHFVKIGRPGYKGKLYNAWKWLLQAEVSTKKQVKGL